jgi:hypothetical protein
MPDPIVTPNEPRLFHVRCSQVVYCSLVAASENYRGHSLPGATTATLFRAQRQFSRFAIGGICRVIRSHRNNSICYATRANRLARGAYPYSFNLPDKVRKPMPSASAVLAR